MGIKNKLTTDSLLYKLYLYKHLIFDQKFFIKRKTYSQFGEDIFIDSFFHKKKRGIYVDIGCYHPIRYSNTAKLFNKGWSGYNIDINKTSIDLFKIARPKDKNIHTILSKISSKKKKYYSLGILDATNSLKKKHFSPKDLKKVSTKVVISEKFENLINEKFDFLNIDCEGSDFEVLKLIDLNKFQPSLICIEILNQNKSVISNYLKVYKYKFLIKKNVSFFFSRR